MLKLSLVPDWKDVLFKSYSMWSMYIGFLILAVPEALYTLTEIETDPYLLWKAGLGFMIFGMVGRVIDQEWSAVNRSKLKSSSTAMMVGVLLAMSQIPTPSPAGATSSSAVTERQFLKTATPFIEGWEGVENHAYLDTIASPPVWTICGGWTHGVKEGDYKTDEECSALFVRQILVYRDEMHKKFTPETKSKRLTPKRDTAYVSLAWNIGYGRAGKSTATKRLNAGDIKGGCHALTWWNKAGGRVIRGLARRRSAEYEYCMAGLA